MPVIFRFRTEWTPWFAWRPVTTRLGEVVWLETVERRAEIVEPFGLIRNFVTIYRRTQI